ncbi:MAG TPA: helix-turn-helix domain-containing protein [Bacillales bacterium]|nr:helix-turn-helix domain-containing protein [Bacillales bacterium]
MIDVQVQDMELFKSLLNPKRVRILKQVETEVKTVKEIAKALEDKPSRLYYHVHQLVDQGFLEVAETRQVGHLTEKYYKAAVVEDFNLSDEFVKENEDFVIKQMLVQVNRAIEAMKSTIDQGSMEDMESIKGQASLLQAELTKEDWHQLNAEIRKLINEKDKESRKKGTENTESISYVLMSYVDEDSE